MAFDRLSNHQSPLTWRRGLPSIRRSPTITIAWTLHNPTCRSKAYLVSDCYRDRSCTVIGRFRTPRFGMSSQAQARFSPNGDDDFTTVQSLPISQALSLLLGRSQLRRIGLSSEGRLLGNDIRFVRAASELASDVVIPPDQKMSPSFELGRP